MRRYARADDEEEVDDLAAARSSSWMVLTNRVTDCKLVGRCSRAKSSFLRCGLFSVNSSARPKPLRKRLISFELRTAYTLMISVVKLLVSRCIALYCALVSIIIILSCCVRFWRLQALWCRCWCDHHARYASTEQRGAASTCLRGIFRSLSCASLSAAAAMVTHKGLVFKVRGVGSVWGSRSTGHTRRDREASSGGGTAATKVPPPRLRNLSCWTTAHRFPQASAGRVASCILRQVVLELAQARDFRKDDQGR